MKIEIDFNQNVPASNLYSANKVALNSSILNCLKMDGGQVSHGQSLRIPTSQYMDSSSITALNFVIDNVDAENLKLVLDNTEK